MPDIDENVATVEVAPVVIVGSETISTTATDGTTSVTFTEAHEAFPKITIGMGEQSTDDAFVSLYPYIKAVGDMELDVLGVPYGGPQDLDSDKQYFAPVTNLHSDRYQSPLVVYYHGYDENRHPSGTPEVIGEVKQVERKADGVWYRVALDKASEYAKRVWDAARRGAARASSGSIAHLVRVAADGLIENWPLVELSLFDAVGNRQPANRHAVALPVMKSIYQAAGRELPDEPVSTNQEGVTMSDETYTKEEVKEMIASAAQAGAEAAIKALPAVTNPGGVAVTHDEGDNPFETLGEQLMAGRKAVMGQGRDFDPRLKKYEIKIANELVGSEGGFLVQQDFANRLLMPVHEQGPFSSRAQKLSISNNANSGTIPGVDETSRADGSRWGGIKGYRLAEGETKHASDFKFRIIQWRLKKYATIVVATDELLEDQAMLQQIIQTGCSEELNFMLNDDMFRGDGIGGAFGYLLSPCLVTVAAEAAQLVDTINDQNVIKMYSRMYARNIRNANWYINPDCFPQIQQLALAIGLGGVPLYIPPTGLAEAPYGTLFGRPVIINEFSSTLGNLGDITFADMSEYLWWEKSSPQAAFSGHIYFLLDKGVFRFVYRSDGQPSWANPLTPAQGTATTSPFVALAAR